MSDNIAFFTGQPIQIRIPDQIPQYASRIIGVMPHALTFSMPYNEGRLVLWPVGSRLEIALTFNDDPVSFTTEVIDRELGEMKAYTVIRPTAISRGQNKIIRENMPRVIAVTGGKGGSGKTVFAINLAIALAAHGQRAFIMDVDLGTANVGVLLGLKPKYNIAHLVSGDRNLIDITVPGPGNIAVIPGNSGLQFLTQLKEIQFIRLINSLNQLDGLADFILLDTSAGISATVTNFLLSSEEIIVVTTPEPHSIADSYALCKVMRNLNCPGRIMLVVNKSETRREGEVVARRFALAARQYLRQEIEYLGSIQDDRLVSRSLKQLLPFSISHPQSAPAKDIAAIAAKLLQTEVQAASGMAGFWTRMIGLLQPLRKKAP